MLATIHQPQYLPWLGYFDKMARADVFVLLDNVQFKKNEWQNRNRIRTAQGWQWITLPVQHDFGQNINEVRLNPSVNWRQQHLRALELNYARTPFLKEMLPQIRPLYEREWNNLAEINIAFIERLRDVLGIKTKLVLSSQLPVTTDKTQRLIDICRAVDCDRYLAGAGCADYMEYSLFEQSGIGLETQHYTHPVYSQVWTRKPEEFVSHLSTLDLLFNCGPESLKVLRSGG